METKTGEISSECSTRKEPQAPEEAKAWRIFQNVLVAASDAGGSVPVSPAGSAGSAPTPRTGALAIRSALASALETVMGPEAAKAALLELEGQPADTAAATASTPGSHVSSSEQEGGRTKRKDLPVGDEDMDEDIGEAERAAKLQKSLEKSPEGFNAARAEVSEIQLAPVEPHV